MQAKAGRGRSGHLARLALALALAPVLGLVALTGSSAGSLRADPAVAGAPSVPLAVVNGTLIDGTGARPVKNAVVLVEDGKIVAAGPRKKVKLPVGVKRLDAGGGTILPGFINAHVHVPFTASELRTWLKGGVTTVRDLSSGPDYESAFAQRDQLDKDPRNARLLAVGPIVTVKGGYPEAIWGGRGLDVSSPEDARAKVEKLIEAGCDTVKTALESGKIFGQSGLPELSVAEMKAIVAVAHEHGLRVSVHAMDAADIAKAVEGGVDEIAHSSFDRVPQSVIERMVAQKIDWVPTLELMHGVGVPDGRENVRRFVKAGGTVVLGTDYAGAPNVSFDHGMPIHEVVYLRQAGLTPMQVILAATRNAASALGRPELGTLRPGKVADLIVVKGNPLKNLRVLLKLKIVVHDGVVAHS